MKTVQMGPLSNLKQRATHLALGLGLAATLAFGAVMPAMAADGEIILEAGTSSVNITNFSFNNGNPVALTGAPNQTATALPEVSMINAEGVSAAFTMTMHASAFVNGESGGAAKTLIANPRVTAAGVDGGTAVFAGYPANVGLSGTTVVAGATVGPGTHAVTPTVEIDIPANTELDDYTSTFTVTFVTAP